MRSKSLSKSSERVREVFAFILPIYYLGRIISSDGSGGAAIAALRPDVPLQSASAPKGGAHHYRVSPSNASVLNMSVPMPSRGGMTKQKTPARE